MFMYRYHYKFTSTGAHHKHDLAAFQLWEKCSYYARQSEQQKKSGVEIKPSVVSDFVPHGCHLVSRLQSSAFSHRRRRALVIKIRDFLKSNLSGVAPEKRRVYMIGHPCKSEQLKSTSIALAHAVHDGPPYEETTNFIKINFEKRRKLA